MRSSSSLEEEVATTAAGGEECLLRRVLPLREEDVEAAVTWLTAEPVRLLLQQQYIFKLQRSLEQC